MSGKRRVAAIAAGLLVLAAGVWIGLLRLGWIKQPYGGVQRGIAWAGDFEEQAYNFGVVVPDRLYRSARPDERWLRELHRRHGIRRVIDLDNGQKAIYAVAARELGIELVRFDWTSHAVPSEAELTRALELLDRGGPTLVHCSGGKDRTGYLVASFRLRKQGWSIKRVLAEMDRYWHDDEDKPHLQAALRRWQSR